MITNSQVRVSRIDLDPGAATQVGPSDYDQLIVSLGRNDFDLVGPVNSIAMSMADDEVEVIKGHWPHRLQNKSTSALHVVVVEVKHGVSPERALCGLNGPSC